MVTEIKTLFLLKSEPYLFCWKGLICGEFIEKWVLGAWQKAWKYNIFLRKPIYKKNIYGGNLQFKNKTHSICGYLWLFCQNRKCNFSPAHRKFVIERTGTPCNVPLKCSAKVRELKVRTAHYKYVILVSMNGKQKIKQIEEFLEKICY